MFDDTTNSSWGLGVTEYPRFDVVLMSGYLALVAALLVLVLLMTRSLWVRLPAAVGVLLILAASVKSPLTMENIAINRPIYWAVPVVVAATGAVYLLMDLARPWIERLTAKWDMEREASNL